MSLLNIDLNADRALIAVDTSAISLEGGAGVMERSKLLHLPHANLVLAARGELVFFSSFFERVCRAPGIVDFDALAASAKAALSEHKQVLLAHMRAAGFDDLDEGCKHEISLIGYSLSAGAMRCATWVYDRASADWLERISGTGLVSPWDPSWARELPDTDTWQAMRLLAQLQVEKMRELRERGAIAIGGRLLLAELTRDAYSLRSVCDLP